MFAGAQNMAIGNWDEIRTAFHVARLGTVSAAAEALGVHHATVIRHIDALEARLGAKLFQRHARGYTATDAGRELLSVAQVADERFSQMAARIGGARDDISGDLIVTSLPGLSNLWMILIKATPLLFLLGIEDIVYWARDLGATKPATFAYPHPDWRLWYFLGLLVFYLLMTSVSQRVIDRIARRLSRGQATMAGEVLRHEVTQ